jgi:hypothetical protein
MADLPHDVVSMILDLADLGIDTRRALGLGPRKLSDNCRNISDTFREDMARMHRRRDQYAQKQQSSSAEDNDDLVIVDLVHNDIFFCMWFLVGEDVCYISGEKPALAF